MNAREIKEVVEDLTSGVHEFIFHPRNLNDLDTKCLTTLDLEPQLYSPLS